MNKEKQNQLRTINGLNIAILSARELEKFTRNDESSLWLMRTKSQETRTLVSFLHTIDDFNVFTGLSPNPFALPQSIVKECPGIVGWAEATRHANHTIDHAETKAAGYDDPDDIIDAYHPMTEQLEVGIGLFNKLPLSQIFQRYCADPELLSNLRKAALDLVDCTQNQRIPKAVIQKFQHLTEFAVLDGERMSQADATQVRSSCSRSCLEAYNCLYIDFPYDRRPQPKPVAQAPAVQQLTNTLPAVPMPGTASPAVMMPGLQSSAPPVQTGGSQEVTLCVNEINDLNSVLASISDRNAAPPPMAQVPQVDPNVAMMQMLAKVFRENQQMNQQMMKVMMQNKDEPKTKENLADQPPQEPLKEQKLQGLKDTPKPSQRVEEEEVEIMEVETTIKTTKEDKTRRPATKKREDRERSNTPKVEKEDRECSKDLTPELEEEDEREVSPEKPKPKKKRVLSSSKSEEDEDVEDRKKHSSGGSRRNNDRNYQPRRRNEAQTARREFFVNKQRNKDTNSRDVDDQMLRYLETMTANMEDHTRMLNQLILMMQDRQRNRGQGATSRPFYYDGNRRF